MCGFVGLWSSSPRAADDLRAIGHQMAHQIASRGPDGEGIWVDEHAGLMLGHRRLSIIDLSAGGNQPMLSHNGRYAMAFNGEIFNFADLRKQLEGEGVQFRSHSDTEVLLEACARWGVTRAVQSCIGMFAFGLWDLRERRLFLVRDRLGIKPLYWARVGSSLAFGSQSKAFRVLKDWDDTLNLGSVQTFLSHGFVRAPESIYQNAHQLLPGTILIFESQNQNPKAIHFWDLEKESKKRGHELSGISEEEATQQLEVLLTDAVRLRMIADVPLGAFLSGGVDSSLVVALMQKVSTSPVRTFTVGFHENQFDESHHAEGVARHLGTRHTLLEVSHQDALGIVPELPESYDEPFADSSQIPTLLLSRLIRKHVTVALSGDGGDELFAGYNRYLWNQNLAQAFRRVPYFIRSTSAAVIRSISPSRWDGLLGTMGHLVPVLAVAAPGDKIHKLAGVFALRSADQIYPHLITQWPAPPIKSHPTKNIASGPIHVRDMQLADLHDYLPNDILTKVDRASMAWGLEARVPLLDHRVVEFAFALPQEWKLRGRETKRILRRVLYRSVPKNLIDRPKMGFGIPLADWLRGPLKDWAEELLSNQSLSEVPYLDSDAIRRKWSEHLNGRRNWQYALWNVLMFQSWRAWNRRAITKL